MDSRPSILAEVYLSGDMTNPRTFPIYQDTPRDHPVMVRDTPYVAPSMQGRLQPEEWRPIVATSVIYYFDRNEWFHISVSGSFGTLHHKGP